MQDKYHSVVKVIPKIRAVYCINSITLFQFHKANASIKMTDEQYI